MNQHFKSLLLLAVAGLILFFIGSPWTGFQGTDELRYGQIAKELEPGRDLFLLHFNGERYSDKPPLYFWTVGLSYEIFGGVSAFALRVPGSLSAIMCALLTYGIAWSLFKRRDVAILAALTLMVMGRFVWIGRWGRLDIMMCMFVYAAMLCFVRIYFHKAGGWAKFWYWTFLGLGFAIKGPAALVAGIGGVAVFLLWQREFKARARELWSWSGFAAMILVNAVWILPIVLLGDSASSQDMIVEQNLGRVIRPDRHVEPIWYYLESTWHNIFPATLFLIAGGVYWFRRRKTDGGRPFGDFHAACRFLIAWALFTFFFFSLYPPKRPQYLLPGFGGAAIFTAFFVDFLSKRYEEKHGDAMPNSKYYLLPGILSIIPPILVGLAVIWHEQIFSLASRFISAGSEAAEKLAETQAEYGSEALHLHIAVQVVGTLLALGAGAFMVRLLLRRRIVAAYGTLVGIVFAGYLALFGWIIPPTLQDDEIKDADHRVAEFLKEQPDLRVIVFGDDKPYFNVYEEFLITYFDRREDDEFVAYMEKVMPQERPILLIIRQDYLGRIDEFDLSPFEPTVDMPIRGDTFTFYRQRALD
ncbi:glycosyltransferase family 39 protein [bacterium]|nr:glycosyltransferase family 39 protein [bacterium]